MSLISASLRVTFSRLIFFFVALKADKLIVTPQNSTSATCRFKNEFIVDVGRCARLAVCGREHSLTRRPLWSRSRGRDNQCGCGKITAFDAQRVVPVLWVGDYVKRVLEACRASATCSSSGHVTSAAVGEGLTPTVNLPRSRLRRVSLSSWVPAVAASASATRVVLLVLPPLQPQLMVVRCVLCGRTICGARRSCGCPQAVF